jgi:hypothetical protein
MAESLPWSPHWEFGISHWQLVTKLHYLSGKRKTCAGVLARLPPREVDAGERLPVSVADDVAPLPVELRIRLFDRPRGREAARAGHDAR